MCSRIKTALGDLCPTDSLTGNMCSRIKTALGDLCPTDSLTSSMCSRIKTALGDLCPTHSLTSLLLGFCMYLVMVLMILLLLMMMSGYMNCWISTVYQCVHEVALFLLYVQAICCSKSTVRV